uniref:TMEM131_like domain-containing protein n=1 Tax=Anopheles atroparvus TaxID=41427 RepID=A0A182J6I1_ANOAO
LVKYETPVVSSVPNANDHSAIVNHLLPDAAAANLLVVVFAEAQLHRLGGEEVAAGEQRRIATVDGTTDAGKGQTGGASSSSSSSSASADGSSSLMDGIILDEEGVLLASGQQTLSEEAALHLQFEPPGVLNFAERSIGDPHNQMVVLYNRHKNRSVYLGSISGSTAEFSSSYFKEKVIAPGGNTSFNVVFLPRRLGPVDGSLLVHTSFGMLRYQVQGEGIECPYRLRPLVGLQAPLNATLSPEITLYNPHDTPLQILEIYSSGGNFLLELPSGAQEGPQALWEIPPHSTRTVIRVRFLARTPGSHVAYVRIKVSGGSAQPTLVDKMLVVPIEVEIFKETGLYSRIPFLELGVTSAEEVAVAASAVAVPVSLTGESGLSVRSGRNVTRLSLDLLNSGSQPVRVKSWGIQADDIEAVLCMHVLVAEERTLHVEFDWSKLASDKRHISGRILLNLERIQTTGDAGQNDSDDDPSVERGRAAVEDVDTLASRTTDDGGEEGLEGGTVIASIYSIPFAGEVLKGSIQYNEEALRFLLEPDHPHVPEEGHGGNTATPADPAPLRPLVIRNHFNVPLSITNASVPENCSRLFTLEDFRPVVLQPGDEWTLLRIGLASRTTSFSSIVTHIRLATNISDYELPVLGYSGKLRRLLSATVRDASMLTALPDSPDEAEELLDLGVLPIGTLGEALVAFVNPNPVPIPIIHWKGAITSDTAVGAPTITVILRGCGPRRLDGLVFCHTVQPGEWIVYQISVQSGTIDRYQGRFTVKTDYEEIVTPLRFTTAVGELHLVRERLRFADCFPGKLCSLSLLAASTFPSKVQIESIYTDVAGLGYEFLSPEKQRPLPPSQPVVLYPDAVTSIGRLTFDPRAHCGPDCYSSFDLLSKPFGVKWMATLDSYEQYRRLDSDKLLQQLQRYAEMRQRLTSVHFQVLAESSRKFEFNASVDLVWPKLLDENVFFPTLQVEQEAVKLITINNPSDQILFVHLVLHDVAVHGRAPAVGGGGGGTQQLPPEVLTGCANCSLSEESVFSFFLFDNDDIYVNYVKPQSFLRIAVKFSARQPGTYSTVLYMRNNLTLVDAAWIQARAVVPQFKFGNRRPGSPTALQFEVTDKHVQLCGTRYLSQLQRRANPQELAEQQRETDEPTSAATDGEEQLGLETRRTFTARNYGEVPIVISGLRIEDLPCEGYGFKVLDCTPFELAPNASRKIEIAFAPDFTLARVVRMLHFDTNINHFPVNFTLLGTIPMHRLELCYLGHPRPWYEPWFRKLLLVVLPTALIGTLVAAMIDANRVLRLHFLSLTREKGPVQPPLDLRQIALQHTASSSGTLVDAGGGSGKHGPSNGNIGSSPLVVTRGNRKSDRRNGGTHAKGVGLQNGNAPSGAESAPRQFSRSWTEFTSKLGGGGGGSSGTAKQPSANGSGGGKHPTPVPAAYCFNSSPSGSNASPTSSSASEGGSKPPSQGSKSRRSATPPKEKIQTIVAPPETVQTASSSNSGSLAAKDRTKPHKQQKHQKHQSAADNFAPTAAKMNVKKTKSLPVSYESVVVSLASVFAATNSSVFTPSSTHSSQTSTSAASAASSLVATSSLSSSSTLFAVSGEMQQATKEPQLNTENQSKLRNGGHANGGNNGVTVVTASKEAMANKEAKPPLSFSSNGGSGSGSSTMKYQPAATIGSGGFGVQGTKYFKENPADSAITGAKPFGDSLGKENSSVGNIIFEKSSQQLCRILVDACAHPTERSCVSARDSTRSEASSSNSSNYKGTALQFNSLGGQQQQQQHKSTTLGTILQNASIPVSTSLSLPGGTGSVWGENCARFSDVVAQTSTSSKSSGQSGQSSTLLGMELLLGLSAHSADNRNSDPSAAQ